MAIKHSTAGKQSISRRATCRKAFGTGFFNTSIASHAYCDHSGMRRIGRQQKSLLLMNYLDSIIQDLDGKINSMSNGGLITLDPSLTGDRKVVLNLATKKDPRVKAERRNAFVFHPMNTTATSSLSFPTIPEAGSESYEDDLDIALDEGKLFRSRADREDEEFENLEDSISDLSLF